MRHIQRRMRLEDECEWWVGMDTELDYRDIFKDRL
jgi:hypothetical protein